MRELADRLESLAEVGQPRGAESVYRRAEAVATGGPPRTRDRLRLILTVAVMAVVAAVGTTALVLVSRGDSESARISAPTAEPDADPGATDEILRLFTTMDEPAEGPEPLYLVPANVPNGLTLLSATGGSAPDRETKVGTSETDRVQTWLRVRRGAPRPVVDSLAISWTAPQADGISLPVSPDAESVTVRGRPGSFEHAAVTWQKTDGRVVSVSGEELTRAELLRIAETLGSRGDGGLELTDPPEGYRFVSETSGLRSSGTNPRELVYSDHAGRGIRVFVTTGTEMPPGEHLQIPPGTTTSGGVPLRTELTTVRERPAVVGNGFPSGVSVAFDPQAFLSDGSGVVAWLEPQNVAVVVAAIGFTEDEVLEFARGLRRVEQAEWDQVVAQAADRTGPAPVSSGSPPESSGG